MTINLEYTKIIYVSNKGQFSSLDVEGFHCSSSQLWQWVSSILLPKPCQIQFICWNVWHEMQMSNFMTRLVQVTRMTTFVCTLRGMPFWHCTSMGCWSYFQTKLRNMCFRCASHIVCYSCSVFQKSKYLLEEVNWD